MTDLATRIIREARDGASVSQLAERWTGGDQGLVRKVLANASFDVRRSGPPRDLAGAPPPPPASGFRNVEVTLIDVNAANTRQDLGDIDALAESIAAIGLLQPLLVTPTPAGRYQLIAGERRLTAAKVAGLVAVACNVRVGLSDDAKLDALAHENLHRKTLNPIEEAQLFDAYRKRGLDLAEIAKRVGCAQSRVSQYLDLLLLDPEQQQLVARRQLTVARARSIATGRRSNRADSGGAHSMSFRVPHFNRTHRLAEDARIRCLTEGHPNQLKMGPACGKCWEATIRDDVARELAPADPRATCQRCSRDYRYADTRCVVMADDRPSVMPDHDWLELAVAAS